MSNQPDAPPEEADRPVPVRVRRAPKFARFIITGAALGVLLGFVVSAVTSVTPADGQVGGKTVTGYLAMIGLLLGGVLGAGLAVLADRSR